MSTKFGPSRQALIAALLVGVPANAFADTDKVASAASADELSGPQEAGPPPEQGATSATPNSSSPGVDVVVVTARQRSENLQEVPLSIAAFNSEDLSAKGANSLSDISLLTPGLNFESYANGGYPVLTLRGLSATSITAFESNVSSFYGGIYLPRAYMVDAGLTGLERVEIVKGPQSALYGRNAFAGAVNYVPLAPPRELTAEAFVTIGSNKRRDFGATVGGPVIPDKVNAIAGYSNSTFDGTWDNAHPNRNAEAGGTTGKMGGWDNLNWFAAVEVTPIDRLSVTLGLNHNERDTEAQGRYNISRNTGQGNCSLVGGVLQFYCGELPLLEAIVDPRSQGLKATSDIFRADVVYELTDEWTANYQFGRIESDAFSYDQTSIDSINGDSPAGVQFLGLPIGAIEADSHEGRLSFDNGPTKATFGVFVSDTMDDNKTALAFAPPLGAMPLSPASPQITIQSQITNIDTRSVFGQFSQDFMDGRLNLSVEGRYTEEDKQLIERLGGTTFEASFDSFTPRVVAKYNLTPVNNIYASAAKGVKSGGFNGGATILDSERAYDPEENWTYELGSKNQFFDRRLQLNAGVFYVDWSNLQTLSTSGNPAFLGTLTRNVGSATAYGFEMDAVAELATGLQGGFSFAYTDPTYGDNLVDPRYQLMLTAAGAPIQICDGVTCPSDGSIGGNVLARQSQYQASTFLTHEGLLPVMGGVEYTIGGDVSYKSKQYVDPLILTWAPDRVLVNLNSSLSYNDFELQFFIKNLFDEEYVASATYNLAGNRNVRYEGVLGEKRTFGATLRYRY